MHVCFSSAVHSFKLVTLIFTATAASSRACLLVKCHVLLVIKKFNVIIIVYKYSLD